MKNLSESLEKVVQSSPFWAEARYHRRKNQLLQVQRGLVKQAKSSITSGVGVRVFVEGAWGFSSTSDLSIKGLEKALNQAVECAKSISGLKKSKLKELPQVKLARGEFKLGGYDSLDKMDLEQQLAAVIKAESGTRAKSSSITSATCMYNEDCASGETM